MTLVGIAYGSYVPQLVQARPDQLDFVEVPFELLWHNPDIARELTTHRVILHCASLNIAGPVRPIPEVIRSLRKWIAATQTPWLGEHLAFTTTIAGPQSGAGENTVNEPYNLGFTVSPPMNSATVQSLTFLLRPTPTAKHLWREVNCLDAHVSLVHAAPRRISDALSQAIKCRDDLSHDQGEVWSETAK